MAIPIIGQTPIVGANPDVLIFTPQLLVVCGCSKDTPNKQLLMLFGFENFSKCPRCHTMLAISGLSAKPGGGGYDFDIKVTPPTPAGQLM